MTDHWDRVKTVFDAALSAGAEHQDYVLGDLCANDASLRDDVRALLKAHRRRGFVDELADCLAAADDAAPADTAVPVRIGRYDVIEKIGEGGMAVVYKGHDSQLNRLVALKLVSPARDLEDDSRRRLMIEARTAAALDHPSIATVYEVGETEDGRVFFAMAFYQGETLQERIARGPVPVADAVRIAHQIASGLAAIHARGITHCDLKPANVLLTTSGAVKLLDFGIAKMAGGDETRSGELLGTLAYMSPEQLRGEIVDARADVWALGLVLNEMLTGERLTADGLRAIVAGDPAPLPHRCVDIPPELDRIVKRALSAALEGRYHDGAELTADLERWAAHSETGRGDSAQAFRLPAPLTTFFGRAREIEDITRRLAGVRLLTLTGPGGTGKTRLALQIAASLCGRYQDGAAFVSLAALSDPVLVCAEIARVLGIPERPTDSAVDALAAFLRGRRMLLVVDNFEHVTPAAPAVTRLLVDCADLHFLVTSRVPLKVAGEHEYPVAPLPHPPADAVVTAEDLAAYPATALFLDRAQAVCPDFTAAGDQIRAIADVCVRLDGLPLAIELAAARVKLFSPRAMLARLDRRFELLSAGGRDRPARHRNLREALAWSYDLLTTDEQTLFRRLSVFVGGCRLEDTAALSQALGPGGGGLLDECAGLIDHSLVFREDGPDGLPRLRMLETIREFACERLEASGEANLARRAHAELFLTLAEQSEPHLTLPDQAAWFDRLEVEHDNLRAALSWSQTNGDRDIALRFGSALWRFWAARGHLCEGRERLERLLAMPGVGQRTLLRARVLNGAATLMHETSEFCGARPLIEESFAIAGEHGDRPLTALVLNNLAWLMVWSGEHVTAGALCEEALRLNRELANPRGLAIALHNLGWLATFHGDYDRACSLHEESLEWRRAHGDLRGAAFAMTGLATAEIKRGALERASRLLEDARATLEGLHDRPLSAWALTVQGVLEHAAGQPAAAFERFEASIELWRAVGNLFGLAFSLIGDAQVALDQGARERALRDLEEALPLLRRTGICYGLGDGLSARARLAAADGDHEGTRRFHAEALQAYTRLGDAPSIRECHEAVARLGKP